MTAMSLSSPALVAALLLGCSSSGGGDDPDATTADAATPDGPTTPMVGPEIDGQVTINEFMAANALTVADDQGAASDWIELHNPTEVDIPLHGYGLTTDLAAPGTVALPAGVVLPAGGHRVLWFDGVPERGPDHVGLVLAKEGGAIGLSRPDGSYIDRVAFEAQETDFSASREPDGSDLWVVEWHPSPGAANPAGEGAPIGAEDPEALPEVVAAAGDLSERVLGYDELPEFRLVLTPEAKQALRDAPRVDVPATLVFDGRAYGPVAVHLKGGGSFMPFDQKPSFRVKIDEYVEGARFFGKKDLTFNNMHDDPSMMHERLAYLVARTAGLPASRSNHARLTIGETALASPDDLFYGLYANTETVKPAMIGRWFADSSGPLFEQTDLDYVPSAVASFELDGGMEDRALLAGLAAALENPDADAAIAAAGAYLDVAQFQRFWAVSTIVGGWDAMPYSDPGDDVFLYGDPTSGKLHLIPWGMDECFTSSSFDPLMVRSVLATRCKASPACLQGYVDQTWALVDLLEEMDLDAERARVKAQIDPFVAADTRRPYDDVTMASLQSAVHFFISERRAKLEAKLPPPSP